MDSEQNKALTLLGSATRPPLSQQSSRFLCATPCLLFARVGCFTAVAAEVFTEVQSTAFIPSSAAWITTRSAMLATFTLSSLDQAGPGTLANSCKKTSPLLH